ncbi:MAG: glycosyltransferase family 4 protein [Flavobacteriaceae bacterium]|nr:glycosyltransferase family 4 protein [Flavobacteriaceae bacterium]
MKNNVTVVYSIERSFVKSDISILEALGLKVYKIHSEPEKTLMYFLYNRLKESWLSVFYIFKSKLLIAWFNDYHSFIPILISKLFLKKSVIIVGGYDAIVDNKNNHGLFLKGGLRSTIAKLNYKMVNEVWIVHKSLENGCDFAKQKFNIISGVRSFTSKKNIVIKEINTGYDTRFWNYDQSEEKTGILTAAFFSEKRVINIKGLNIFNKLASLLPNINFTIAGESGIRISDFINLESNIKVMGVQNRSQMKELYQKNKFYFQGSRLEGLPNSLCEAMLCGCIPIGSRVFGIPDAIGKTGVLFDTEKDIEQIVEFVNSDLGATDSKNARNRVVRKYDISKRTEKIKQNIF